MRLRSCRVTTIDSTSPSAAWIGVALAKVVTLWPSGTVSVIPSARTASAVFRVLTILWLPGFGPQILPEIAIVIS